jgi:hypothetical protein
LRFVFVIHVDDDDNVDTQLNVIQDFTLDDDKLELSDCIEVAVDRYVAVDACASGTIELSGNDHYTVASVAPGSSTVDANLLAPLSLVAARNPPPIDCVSTTPLEFRTVERPVVLRVEPAMRCVVESEQSVVAVSETPAAAFLRVDGVNSTFNYNVTRVVIV